MIEILAAVLLIALAWSCYDTDRRIDELEEEISRLKLKRKIH